MSGNKVSTVNCMELLQNPEVHQLDCLVFNVDLSDVLLSEGHKHCTGISRRSESDTVCNAAAALGERNLKTVACSAFQYVCDRSYFFSRLRSRCVLKNERTVSKIFDVPLAFFERVSALARYHDFPSADLPSFFRGIYSRKFHVRVISAVICRFTAACSGFRSVT